MLITGYLVFQSSEKQLQHSDDIAGNKASNPIKTDSISLRDLNNVFVQKKDITKTADGILLNNKTNIATHENTYRQRNSSVKFKTTTNRERSLIINSDATVKYEDLNYLNTEIKKGNDGADFNDQPVKDSISEQQKAINEIAEPIITDSTSAYKSLSQTDSTIISGNKANHPANKPVEGPGKLYKIPNWQWGITAFYGKSNAVGSLLDFNKSALAYVNMPGNISNDTVVNTAHPFSASDAYQFGGIVQKKISKNGFLATGVNFIHLSTKANVSQKVDSAVIIPGSGSSGNYNVSQYYQPGPLKNYTVLIILLNCLFIFSRIFFPQSKFHFLIMPVFPCGNCCLPMHSFMTSIIIFIFPKMSCFVKRNSSSQPA